MRRRDTWVGLCSQNARDENVLAWVRVRLGALWVSG